MAFKPPSIPPAPPAPPAPSSPPAGAAQDSLITTWPRRDIVANQRVYLLSLDGDPRFRHSRTAAGWQTVTPEGIAKPPGIPDTARAAPTYSVYRYTRGINDLTNSGMGYGEPTEEKRCVPSANGSPRTLTSDDVCMQRTRSGRQPLDEQTIRIIKARPVPASDPDTSDSPADPTIYDPATKP